MTKIRVLLADDHSLFREGLASILNGESDFETIGEARDGLEAISKARELKPDLILMDVMMPTCDGLEATRQIKREMPGVTIVMLTISEDSEKLFAAIRNGAQGYLLKNVRRAELLALLRGALRGEAAITPVMAGWMLEEFRRMSQQPAIVPAGDRLALSEREREVLALVASGASNKEIAEKLCISIHTVRSHMRKLLDKLQVTNRREAASLARQEGWTSPPRRFPR